jgi:sugar lactone lactonase YvrE
MKKSSFFLALIFVSFQINAQNIATIAGNGIPAFFGDFGLAVNAKLDSPADVEVDKIGNVYIADMNNSRIRKINTSGIITTIAGNGTIGFSGDGGLAISSVLGRPTGITLDSIGNIYFLDRDNNRIRKINTSGIITTIAGNGTIGYTGDGGNATLASFGNGFGISSDKAGNIFIADFDNQVIRKVNTSGIISTVAGNGIAGNSGDGGPAINAQLNFPNWVAVDLNGNIFISDMNNNKIRKVNTAGIISTFAGNMFGSSGFNGDGGPATSALLSQPQDIDIDSIGNVFVQDGINDRIRIINTSGIINTYAGNGTLGYSGDGGLATFANIGGRAGLCVDNNSNLFLAEAYTHRIRKIGSITTSINQFKIDEDLFNVFPNPIKDKLTIETKEKDNVLVQIIDARGQIVMTEKVCGKSTIDVSTLSNGIYIVLLTNSNQINSKKTIIVNH